MNPKTWAGVVGFSFARPGTRCTLLVQTNNRLPATSTRMTTTSEPSYLAGMNRLRPYNLNNPLKFLKNGDVIRLNHVPTTRNLHSHTVLAPVSKLNYEVSCYGNETLGNKHDYWRIKVMDDINHGTNVNHRRFLPSSQKR